MEDFALLVIVGGKAGPLHCRALELRSARTAAICWVPCGISSRCCPCRHLLGRHPNVVPWLCECGHGSNSLLVDTPCGWRVQIVVVGARLVEPVSERHYALSRGLSSTSVW